jgi:sialic acid synthase SpsE
VLTISGVGIGGENPCRFVAELGNAHNGDFDRAIRLIDATKAAGADFVKFQCYSADELVALRGDGPAPEPWGSQGWTMRTLYEKAATPFDWFPRLAQHCRDIGMPWFSSVFGLDSLSLLERCACPAYKVARLDNYHSGLIQAVVSRGKPVFVSRHNDEGYVTNRRFDTGHWTPDHNVWPLWCPPNYPTAPSDVRLPFFPWAGVANRTMVVGLSSHCLDARLPVAAVARGCKLIEMHFQLDDEPSELEANVSLTASQFRRMVDDVRAVEAMLA